MIPSFARILFGDRVAAEVLARPLLAILTLRTIGIEEIGAECGELVLVVLMLLYPDLA